MIWKLYKDSDNAKNEYYYSLNVQEQNKKIVFFLIIIDDSSKQLLTVVPVKNQLIFHITSVSNPIKIYVRKRYIICTTYLSANFIIGTENLQFTHIEVQCKTKITTWRYFIPNVLIKMLQINDKLLFVFNKNFVSVSWYVTEKHE